MSALEELAAAVDSELQRAASDCSEEEEDRSSNAPADCSGSDTDSWTLLDEEDEVILEDKKGEEETQQPSIDSKEEESP